MALHDPMLIWEDLGRLDDSWARSYGNETPARKLPICWTKFPRIMRSPRRRTSARIDHHGRLQPRPLVLMAGNPRLPDYDSRAKQGEPDGADKSKSRVADLPGDQRRGD